MFARDDGGSSRFVDAARGAELGVHAWTVACAETAAALAEAGFDAIVCDHSDVARAYVARRGAAETRAFKYA